MKVKNLVLVALFAALTAIAGLFLKFPAPIVEFSFQSLFVVIAGLLLGAKLGALSQIVYVAIGLIGLPVFTKGGGPGYIFEPSFGYLIGFIVGAFLCGLFIEKVKKLTIFNAITASFICMAAVYIVGVFYLYLIKDLYQHNPKSVGYVLYYGLVIFLPYDIIKCVAAAFLVVKLRPILIKSKLIEAK